MKALVPKLQLGNRLNGNKPIAEVPKLELRNQGVK